MENFFVEDKFYTDFDSFIEDHFEEWEEDKLLQEAKELEDDWAVKATEAELQPIVTLSPTWISERIDDERWPEDDDRISNKVSVALDTIDYAKVNSMMPQLYYGTRKKFTITKQDVINYLNQ